MSEGVIATRIGCPDVCPDGVDIVGLPSFKDLDRRAEVPKSLMPSIVGFGDETEMVPLLQSREGKVVADNGYADDMFPICKYALRGADIPGICPKQTLIRNAIDESLATGSSLI